MSFKGQTSSDESTDSEQLNCSGFSTDLEPLNCSYQDDFLEDTVSPNKSSTCTAVIGHSTPDKLNSAAIPHPDVSPVARAFSPSKCKKMRDPIDVLRSTCCTKKCMKTFSPLEIELCEVEFRGKNATLQRQYILDNIRDKSHVKITQTGKKVVSNNFILRGKSVCEKAWCIAHDITYKRFLRCQKLYEMGFTLMHHGNFGRSFMQEKTTEALGWMQYLFERIGDWMPHKTQIHLPSTCTKRSLYERMVKEFSERGVQKTISYEHFTSVWADHLPHCVIAKRSEFTECTICANLKERRSKALTNFEHKQVTDMIAQHTLRVEKERKEYQTARETARRQPKDLTVIIIDGMDQAKTDVPHFTRRDKGSVHLTRLPVHITGVLIHTGFSVPDGKVPLVFLDNKDIPHDSNMTMNCLLKSIMLQKDRLGRALFLQMDNCFRENKNRYIISFATLLVQLMVFEEVTMHFLPVGHTHEDVDQLFSCIAAKIRTANVYTLDDLTSRISTSYKPHISVHDARPVLNIKKWIEPHMFGEFRHHSHPHWFRFRLIDGECRMHWKMWQSCEWEPRPDANDSDISKGLRCLKSTPSLSPVPSWVKPCLEKVDVPALERDILHSEGYLLRLPQCAYAWWQKFLENILDKEQVPDTPDSWALEELQGRLLREQSAIEEDIPPETQLIKNKLSREFPKVTIGNQGKETEHLVEEDSRDSIMVGQMAAVHLDDKSRRPYIGRILEKSTSCVKVHWFKGSWLKEWKPWNVGKGRNTKPYADEVAIQSIILWGFSLSSWGCLNSTTRSELKRIYSELDDQATDEV